MRLPLDQHLSVASDLESKKRWRFVERHQIDRASRGADQRRFQPAERFVGIVFRADSDIDVAAATRLAPRGGAEDHRELHFGKLRQGFDEAALR